MCAVSIEESAPIRAEFFDHLLRRYRPLRDYPLCDSLRRGLAVRAGYLHSLRLSEFHSGIRFEVLDDSLRNQHERARQANWQQNPEQAASRVHPEVSELVGFTARDASNDRDRQHNTYRRRNEV